MEDADGSDTEALLALLSSLLDPPIPELHILLDALICANGEVETAAKSLQLNHASNAPPTCTTKKRAATGVLDDWLTSPVVENVHRRKKRKFIAPSTRPKKCVQMTSRSVITGPSTMPGSLKQPVSLMDVLRPPPPTSPTVPRLAPLMLSNPAMVEKHTPCTLHLGVLPRELACRLFYYMVDASKGVYFCDNCKVSFNMHSCRMEATQGCRKSS